MSVTDLVSAAAGPTPSVPLPSSADAPTPTLAELAPGTRVEVRRKFDSKWAHGFEVAEATDQGYRVRRLSDGELIPVPIPEDDLRKEKKRSNWWY